MRYLLFALSFGAVLSAQEPPASPAPAPQTLAVPAQPASPAPGKTLNDPKESLRQRLQDFLKQRAAGAPAPGEVNLTLTGKAKVTLAPGQPCSIPLKEVVPRDADKIDPKIVIPQGTRGFVHGFIREVKPPAPPCEALKR